jgi:hypothetical protein
MEISRPENATHCKVLKSSAPLTKPPVISYIHNYLNFDENRLKESVSPFFQCVLQIEREQASSKK